MRKDFDAELIEFVRTVTGLDGDMVYAIAGTAAATAFIGKIPVKTDTAAYLGISKKYYDQLMKHAVDLSNYYGIFDDYLMSYVPAELKAQNIIYPIATELILSGFYPEKTSESAQRSLARAFLGEYFAPQAVQSRTAFIGFNISLEYLWAKLAGSDEKVDAFARARYSGEGSVCKHLQAFSDIVYEYEPTLIAGDARPRYGKMLRALEIAMKKGTWKTKMKNSFRMLRMKRQISEEKFYQS